MSYFDVTRREFLAASSAALFVTSWRKAIGETGSPTGHSPFIATDADIEQIRSLIKSNATAAGLYQDLQRTAQGMVAQQPAEYALRGGNILNQSRTSLARTYTLGLLWRLDGNPECLQRALMELRTAASFPDWHTAHFLDTAEMTHAVAAGYSWFYPA